MYMDIDNNVGSDVGVMDVVVVLMDMPMLDEGAAEREDAGVFVDSRGGV